MAFSGTDAYSARIEKLNLMEQRLAAINWQPQDLNNRVLELENVLERKEKHIDSLEKQLSEQ
ncbi:Hypothetical predicted protein, partial [Octopus vulgaris]